MKKNEVTEELNGLLSCPNFSLGAEDLVNGWSRSRDAFDAVEPVLRFMECNPSVDYGMPGPLVHFVEGFFGKGYEAMLLESVTRRPTPHTLWMLNRLINGTTTPLERQHSLDVLRRAAVNPATDDASRQAADRFILRLESSG
jgi:hypothetical protein